MRQLPVDIPTGRGCPLYSPGVGACAFCVAEKSTRSVRPCRTEPFILSTTRAAASMERMVMKPKPRERSVCLMSGLLCFCVSVSLACVVDRASTPLPAYHVEWLIVVLTFEESCSSCGVREWIVVDLRIRNLPFDHTQSRPCQPPHTCQTHLPSPSLSS